MRATDFETLVPDAPITALPVGLRQTPSRAAPFLLAALAMPAAAVSLVPFALIGEHLVRDASLVIDRAGSVAALASTFVLWIAVFAWPIAVRAGRASCAREISIADGHVSVTDRGWFGTGTWREPISAYDGLTHRVRSSLSGTRHELILVHPYPSRNVLLRVAPRIGEAEIEQAIAVLGCREIAPRVIYPPFGVTAAPLATAA